MTPDERQILKSLFERIRQVANLPRDGEAEALIAEEVRAQPYAPYLLSQTVVVQDQALNAAAARIEDLEAQVRGLQEGPSQKAPAGAASAPGGFLERIGASLFEARTDAGSARSSVPAAGGAVWTQRGQSAAQSMPAVPQPGVPNRAPNPWEQRGGGFLQGALGVAAGVAGGVLLANTIGGLMGGNKETAADAEPGAGFQNADYDEEMLDSGLGEWDLGEWGGDSADI